MDIIPCGISDGNPDVNSVADSEWTVVRSVLGIQLHVPLGKVFTCMFVPILVIIFRITYNMLNRKFVVSACAHLHLSHSLRFFSSNHD